MHIFFELSLVQTTKKKKSNAKNKQKERINRSNVADIYVLQKYDSINQERANTGKKRNKYSFNFALVILILMTDVTTPKRFSIVPHYDNLW